MSDTAAIRATTLAVLCEVLHESAENLRAQPVLAAHDWDSLSSLEALAQLESRLHVRLDLRAYQSARTIEDLVALITGMPHRTAAVQL